ncbi:MAG TPA: serine/threonine protein kinase, partial [Polyangiaceae bacterium]|nr:serine/threonine protein kinase [Polyangiaceae bacterium]
MAAVYGGVHRNGHVVALKILHERLSADPEVERLFRREAHLANTIQHPGVVPVIDDDIADDGSTF